MSQTVTTVQTISRKDLEGKLAQTPDNVTRDDGYALVNVLSPEVFAKEHIPDSINIPQGEINRLEEKFSRDKEIIVYCASADCDASTRVAKTLQEHGFTNVYDYAEGLKGWKEAGNSTAGVVSGEV